MGRRILVHADAFAGQILRREELRARGISSARLAGPEFAVVFPGFLTPRDHPASVRQICQVLQTDVLPRSCLTHATAAALWGIPVPLQLDGGVSIHLPHLARPQRGRPTWDDRFPPLGVTLHCRDEIGTHRGAGPRVRVHRSAPWGPIARLGELRMSAPFEVLCELATLLGHADLVAAVDGVLGPDFALGGITKEDIRSHVERRPRFRGRVRLLRAVTDARMRVESPGETFMRLIVTNAGFPEFECNAPVRDALNRMGRRLDGAYRTAGIGLEFDGEGHRAEPGQARADEARRDGLAAEGWVLRRWTADDLRDPDAALVRLHCAGVERGLPVPPMGSWRGRVLLEGAADYSRGRAAEGGGLVVPR